MKKKLSTQHLLIILPIMAVAAIGFYSWVKTAVYEMVTVRTDVESTVEVINISNEESPNQPSGFKPIDDTQVSARMSEIEKDEILEEKLEIDADLEEQVYYMHATPNDTIYPQWYTDVIDAPDGWDTSTGSTDTVVAVIDTGFALEHEDLSSAWLINSGEQGTTSNGEFCWTGSPEDKQTNSCDDDQNGFVDDWRGWDFSNGDNNSQAGDNSADGASHGTKVAGLVGARSDNSTGVAAINWQTKIMPLQGMYDEGYGFSTHIALAIVYAVDNGADVINMSLGGPLPDSIIYAAVRYATDNNVIVVASSGNCGNEQSSPQCSGYPSPGGMGYPARYEETIAVGATNSADNRAGFSSYGSELDIVAPGSGTIRTPTWTSSNDTAAYSTTSYGTSFASPIVAGLAATIVGEFNDLAKDEVLAIMVGGADKVTGMNGNERTNQYGWGRINLDTSLDEIDEYRDQLLKTEGTQAALKEDTKPLVTSSYGHTNSTAIKNNKKTVTYCVAEPNTNCSLTLRRGASTRNLGTRLTNQQGIVTWTWGRNNVGSAGVWTATVSSGGETSEGEDLIVQ